MGSMAFQITTLAIVNSTFYTGADKKKHHCSASPAGSSTVTGEFPAQMAIYGENVFIWWCHRGHAVGSCAANIESGAYNVDIMTEVQILEHCGLLS